MTLAVFFPKINIIFQIILQKLPKITDLDMKVLFTMINERAFDV